MITTINFHLLKACNFKCKFCYATFNDINEKKMSKNEQFELIKQLAESKMFKKINFAGGEPTLIPYIKELIIYAKLLGFETSIVTNASKIDFDWVKSISEYLDILTISIDSFNRETNLISGRSQEKEIITKEKLEELAKACHMFDIHLKINTVASQFNQNETLTALINKLKPFRWKILQATKVEGQNDSNFNKVKITQDEFSTFCKRNKRNLLSEIKVIEENENIIQGSYLMIDQLGRFFDSNKNKHNYSGKILALGIETTLKEVSLNTTKFKDREGNYTTLKNEINAHS